MKAIYLNDIIEHKKILIFELIDDKFVCIDDNEIAYDKDIVLNDKSWIILRENICQ